MSADQHQDPTPTPADPQHPAEPTSAGGVAEPAGAGPSSERQTATKQRAGADPGGGREPGAGTRILHQIVSANTVTVSVLSVLLALVVGAILIVVSSPDLLAEYSYFFAAPGRVLGDSWTVISTAYYELFKGAIVDPDSVRAAVNGTGSWAQVFYPISETVVAATPLIFTGLAVALAFRGGLFNIGAQGQAVMGGIGAGLVGFELHLPVVLHLILAMIGALVAGGLWGSIAGVLKARRGAHEVIVTIMLNYIAASFLIWLIKQKGVQNPTRTDAISKTVDSTARLGSLGFGLRWNIGIVIGIAFAIAVTLFLSRTAKGFELRAVGANPHAARTAGMSVPGTYMMIMLFSGALAGLGGGVQVLGPAGALTPAFAGTIGFDGITVALLGRARPVGVVLSALLFGALNAGGNRMQLAAQVPIDLVTVIQAVIVIFIAAPALVKEIFRLRGRPTGVAGTMAKGW
jgi:simple sugar transport system permease protein